MKKQLLEQILIKKKHKAVKGSLLSTIGFVIIKAEDQSKIKANGNNLII